MGCERYIPESLPVVGEPGDGDRPLHPERIGTQPQGEIGAEDTVDGRRRGEQLQDGPDPQPGRFEANSVRRTIPGKRMDGKPLLATGQIEVGLDPVVEAVDEVVAGIDGPGLESELRIGPERYADEGVVPCGVDLRAQPFAAAAVALEEVGPGGILYDVAVDAGGGQVVEIPGGVGHPEGVLQPGPVLARRHLHTVEADASRCQPFDLQPERHGQRVALRAAHLQPTECHLLRAQEVVQDVVPSGRELQPEVGQGGSQRIHVEPLGAYLLHQHFDAPGQGRFQRIECLRGPKLQAQIPRLHLGPGLRRVGAEDRTGGANAIDLRTGPDGDTVQGDPGVVASGTVGRGFGIEEKQPADRLGNDAQCRKVEPPDLPGNPGLLPLFAQHSFDSERKVQGRIAIFDPAGEPSLRKPGLHAEPAEVVPAILRPGNLQPELSPGSGRQRIEPFALCAER